MPAKLVITGMGAVTPLGNCVSHYWTNLVAGKSGVNAISRFNAANLPVRIAAEIREFTPAKALDPSLLRSASPFMQYAFNAGLEALEDAKLIPIKTPERSGICFGTAMSGVCEIYEKSVEYINSRTGKVSPHFVPRAIGNMAAAHLAITFGIKGPGFTIGTACSAGNDAIITAALLLGNGEADAVLVVGAESILAPPVISSLALAKALSRNNDCPKEASKPFDLMRDGFVIGEGAGAIVLETETSAQKRSAKPLAILAGWANTLDAWHVTAPDPSGEGAARCMRLALQKARLKPEDIGYINAHGTATQLGDKAETVAIKSVFGSRTPPVSSTKSATGHLMGAGGITEAIACVKALHTSLLPPTINLHTPDPYCDLDYIPNKARHKKISAAMSNSLGFGGQNSTIILTKPDMQES